MCARMTPLCSVLVARVVGVPLGRLAQVAPVAVVAVRFGAGGRVVAVQQVAGGGGLGMCVGLWCGVEKESAVGLCLLAITH